MVSAKTAIFISHVNGDPDAEPVLDALVDDANGLKARLQDTHDAYEIAYDREIIAGAEWRRAIYDWLVDCAAAVVLVSKGAFEADKPWVSHEATVLTILQWWRRDLCIVPVLLTGAEALFTSKPTFSPGRLPSIQALRYPDAQRPTPEALVAAIAERLKQALPPRGTKRLTGLAAELQQRLDRLPEEALSAAATVLDPATANTDAARLAERFLAADDIKAQQAFYALCHASRDVRHFEAKAAIACILGAQQIGEADAKPFAIEAAMRGASAGQRALLFDCEDPSVLSLYLTRVARRVPHAWEVNDAPDVLEFGRAEDLKKSVRAFVMARYGSTAGRSESLQFTRGRATIGSLRQGGFPVLLRLDYPADRDPAADVQAIRDVCADLLVLYTAPPEIALAPPPGAELCQVPPLGLDGYERLIGPYGALLTHCDNTTPREESSP